ncbi:MULTISPECIES: aminoacyl-tRNA hydrolase [Marinobacter]|jgi:PTH1 family peptidyl-tRNA hydrolase|uniref:Peptidyl-tRNA hydrolase n=2 Tax=Marinobacter TaxID=2742 RepID=W5YQB7_9GAMM|nr:MULTISPECIES: aminoacyl-tRNA hydrolase [Marinobacter]AHI31387.1 peptidyl-tRNA hydrolase [Marinobacter salarius]ARM85250.1 peptidyl-tRNA hydrolase [Marinobacter salarius]AZR40138.1 aminoacyl-tRNA hydrolase [Marinobacter salarius]KXJ46094.1 MAG: peptidyl-tRNA hydrolase [Marinobacter sp. Hex_13]MAB50354.1 aminoacyl-tRNA hydrolase [Marinobacter sp.]|tara:strand:- start:3690 stop:4277 length:588 start_codon:yes stop_codon:yes gene_type:complete
MAQDILMVVGLGNPGPDYANTRHNAGALFVEALARETGQSLRPEKKYHGLYARIQLQGLDLHLLNPSTYMNRSGLSIKALADFFKIQPQQILVAHDELDLPPGTAKLKKGGGHGGHNGLRDTIAHLGTNDFQRLRIGIGHPGDSRQVTGYVLGRLGKRETEELNALIDEIIRVLPDAASGKLPAAMNRLHSFKPV